VHTKYTVVAKVPVYVRPLDFGALLATKLRLGPLGRVLGAPLGVAYRALFARRMPLASGEEVVRLEQLDAAIEVVSRDFADMVKICIERSARFLTWRFREKPTHEYAIWSLRRDGRLRAYVVTKPGTLYGSPCVILLDFGCAAGEEDALLRLIAARLPAERADGAAAAVTMGLHPFFARLGRLGFRRVPERINPRPFHFVAKALTAECDPAIFDPRSWFVTLADWDVL